MIKDMIQLTPTLRRLDSFPYRHRVADVMARPVLTGAEGLTLAQACARMERAASSSLVIVDARGLARGILTERDVIRAVGQRGESALGTAAAALMSAPVHSIAADTYLYIGIARMSRLGLRHLLVTDAKGRPAGMLTARHLLKVRSVQALIIGDDLTEAETAADLRRAHDSLPILAENLLDDGVAARDTAAVISAVLRDITARAAQLVEHSLAADGYGAAPAPWALLILGSGGRGESLLACDQDHALVHEGTADHDRWYAAFATRFTDLLAEAGLPPCPGGVMASNPDWRRPLADWQWEIRRWVFEPQSRTMRSIDLFFDAQPVHGDAALAGRLHRYAIETAGTSAFFTQFLALNVAAGTGPLGLFGQIPTWGGRFNAKTAGLFPIVAAIRAKAVRNGIAATGTLERLRALQATGVMLDEDAASLTAAYETLLRQLLRQQLADIAAGRPPGHDLIPARLGRQDHAALKTALRRIRVLKQTLPGRG
ncbi:putative nucleotidyltransferase substrate binding domain protein [mine drainage metagenome]|uniref:Putative nucleotidyltransferase substrate binding domain protein n=1 Tax=mine drainage metagenome TaxID=410659 RepID=A0A1J5R748_9ZZZZ